MHVAAARPPAAWMFADAGGRFGRFDARPSPRSIGGWALPGSGTSRGFACGCDWWSSIRSLAPTGARNDRRSTPAPDAAPGTASVPTESSPTTTSSASVVHGSAALTVTPAPSGGSLAVCRHEAWGPLRGPGSTTPPAARTPASCSPDQRVRDHAHGLGAHRRTDAGPVPLCQRGGPGDLTRSS
jgi:hypothetical protein